MLNKMIIFQFLITVFFIFSTSFVDVVSSINADENDIKPDVEIKEEDMFSLLDEALDYAQLVGYIRRNKNHLAKSDDAVVSIFTLLPSPFPRQAFEEITSVQKAMQLLYFRISSDYKFLLDCHIKVFDTDPVMRKMFVILRDVYREGIHQPISVLLLRADHMLNVVKDENNNETYEIKQVEVNVGPIGGAGLVPKVTEIHRRMAKKAGIDASLNVIPENRSDTTLARALYVGWQAFGNKEAILLILISKRENNMNVWDQRYIQYEIERMAQEDSTRIKIVVMPLRECTKKLTLNEEDFSVHFEHRPIGLVYYHKAFNIGSNPLADEEWDAILMFERSTAIKSPSMGGALCDSKKVQQILAEPGMVERFFPEPEDVETIKAIRKTFAGLWALEHDDVATKKAIKDAIANPDHYVLKPNREGGGNNYWGEKIVEKLENFKSEELAEHILMQRLYPLVVKNYLFLKPYRSVEFANVVVELCTYGGLVGNIVDGTVLHNEQGGHLTKTKRAHITEGGVSIGAGVRDSPYLF